MTVWNDRLTSLTSYKAKACRDGNGGAGKRISRMLLLLCLIVTLLSAALSGCGSREEDGSTADVSTGLIYVQNGRYEEAIAMFQELISMERDLEDAYRGLGIACMGSGDLEGAVQAFENALKEAGAVPGEKEYDINYYLGSCYYKLGDYKSAEEVYDAIIALRQADPDVYVMRGSVRLALEDEAGMEEDFKKAISLDPEGYDRIAVIYEKMSASGYEEKARSFIDGILEKQGSSMTDFDRGRLAFYTGDYQTARTAMEKVNNGRDYEVALLLGQTYEALGDYNYATSVYETYVSNDQTHAEVYNQLGLCSMKMGDYQAALTAFQTGQKVENNEILQSLAFNEISAYEYLGDFQRALALMQEYIRRYPSDTKAQREYQFLKTR